MVARLLPNGESAVLVEVDTLGDALALHAWLTGPHRPAGLLDCVPGARTVLLVADSPSALAGLRGTVDAGLAAVTAAPSVAQSAEGLGGAAARPPGRETGAVEIPVVYDGEDLDEVAILTGLSREGVVAAHTGTPWTVGFAGFAPGFAYLVGGDPRLRVPRRSSPRARVPAGSVGLADEFSGIYPRPSPGGWQLIGRTDTNVWDLDRHPPALLRPGLRVRFVEAGGER